jgi:L-2,4-diaminobutyrate transaminase
MCAIEFVEDRDTRKQYDPVGKIGPQIAAALLKRGVIGRAMPHGDIIGFAPPLILSREEADEIVSATHDSVVEVLGE